MAKVVAAERRANEAVRRIAPILVTYEDAGAAGDLRKPSDRGGTCASWSIDVSTHCLRRHARALTGEIGPILTRRLEKIRNCTRVEFLCGAARCGGRADYDALSRIAQAFCVAR